jgi:hypothetical protein
MSRKPTSQSSDETPSTPSSKGGRFKTLLLAAGLLVGEAVVLLGGYHYVAGPKTVSAETDQQILNAPEQRITELPLINERLTNNRMGAVYVYPVEIYVQVIESDSAWWNELTGQYKNEIRAEISALWRSADQLVLDDPKLEVMTRRVQSLLRTRFEGEANPEVPRISKVVIVPSTGFRIRS